MGLNHEYLIESCAASLTSRHFYIGLNRIRDISINALSLTSRHFFMGLNITMYLLTSNK